MYLPVRNNKVLVLGKTCRHGITYISFTQHVLNLHLCLLYTSILQQLTDYLINFLDMCSVMKRTPTFDVQRGPFPCGQACQYVVTVAEIVSRVTIYGSNVSFISPSSRDSSMCDERCIDWTNCTFDIEKKTIEDWRQCKKFKIEYFTF